MRRVGTGRAFTQLRSHDTACSSGGLRPSSCGAYAARDSKVKETPAVAFMASWPCGRVRTRLCNRQGRRPGCVRIRRCRAVCACARLSGARVRTTFDRPRPYFFFFPYGSVCVLFVCGSGAACQHATVNLIPQAYYTEQPSVSEATRLR